jgi:hypothetical protein
LCRVFNLYRRGSRCSIDLHPGRSAGRGVRRLLLPRRSGRGALQLEHCRASEGLLLRREKVRLDGGHRGRKQVCHLHSSDPRFRVPGTRFF